jgi:hypothetical protein
MTIQLRWTESDIASAHWAYLRYSPWRLARQFRRPIVAVAVSIIILFQYPESWRIVGWLILLDVGAIAFDMFFYRRTWNQYFKKTPLWNDIVSATVDGQSIRLEAQSFKIAKDWGEFANIYESTRLFVFGRSDNKLLFLPKSGISESQIVELRTIISASAKGTVNLGSPVAKSIQV